MSELFESDVRRRLYVLIQDYPGLHVREIARRLGVPVRLVEYHAEVLLREQILAENRDGNYQRLFPSQTELPLTGQERQALGALRMPVPLAITLSLLDADEGLTHGELCRRTGASKANASHHLKRLEAASIIERHDGTVRLCDAERTRKLLQAHKPVPDLRKRFADAWASIYRV